ncbi:ATP-binding protein [Microbacterium bovistercoris]|uniref:ATP-binding protein n=1 Tax=Microbacterium bovistercoris TaxID=2293570 RepID=A0A371NSF0_9MICO|nr:DUF4143 domain-containing protein [Microbacterium bovistercoris]REJ05132.1 ATP-binding protein [Microbacterium bovistercoris]
MSEYMARVVDEAVSAALDHPVAVLLEGPRACGKSATGRHHSGSSVQLDVDQNALRLVGLDPSRVLAGARPRFIDEWQLAPELWNHVRAAVDVDDDGRFILAGSAVPADDTTRHSGAGRILRFRMRPMSLAETGRSTSEVSLAAIFAEPTTVTGSASLSVPELAETVVRGGWPGLRELPTGQVIDRLQSYLEDTARVDIPLLADEPRRDPEGVSRVLRALARSTATEVSNSAIARDASAGDTPMSNATVQNYLSALARVFVIEDQPSWGPQLRSRDRVRKAPRRHFADPSLATAAMGADADRLLNDLEYFGLVFESMVIRDLRVYAEPLGGIVRHYRDSAGREVDAIIERRDGSWMAVEIKLAESREEEAAASLKRFAANLDTARTQPPVAMVIVTGGRYAFTRPDGIHLVPIGVLGP